MAIKALTLSELQDLPITVPLGTAAQAWGFSRSKAYDLVARKEFPCRVIRVGNAWRVTRRDLFEALGLDYRTAFPIARADGGEVA